MSSNLRVAASRTGRTVASDNPVWFETRWGLVAFTVAVCLIGSGLLLYLGTF